MGSFRTGSQEMKTNAAIKKQTNMFLVFMNSIKAT